MSGEFPKSDVPPFRETILWLLWRKPWGRALLILFLLLSAVFLFWNTLPDASKIELLGIGDGTREMPASRSQLAALTDTTPAPSDTSSDRHNGYKSQRETGAEPPGHLVSRTTVETAGSHSASQPLGHLEIDSAAAVRPGDASPEQAQQQASIEAQPNLVRQWVRAGAQRGEKNNFLAIIATHSDATARADAEYIHATLRSHGVRSDPDIFTSSFAESGGLSSVIDGRVNEHFQPADYCAGFLLVKRKHAIVALKQPVEMLAADQTWEIRLLFWHPELPGAAWTFTRRGVGFSENDAVANATTRAVADLDSIASEISQRMKAQE